MVVSHQVSLLTYFRCSAKYTKSQKFGISSDFFPTKSKQSRFKPFSSEPEMKVSFQLTEEKKPHTIGETNELLTCFRSNNRREEKKFSETTFVQFIR